MNFPRDLSFSFLGSELRFMIVKQKMAELETFYRTWTHKYTNCILQYEIHPINNLHSGQRRHSEQLDIYFYCTLWKIGKLEICQSCCWLSTIYYDHLNVKLHWNIIFFSQYSLSTHTISDWWYSWPTMFHTQCSDYRTLLIYDWKSKNFKL